ncbi:MAG: hypothetical protein BWX45_00592 [Deltaproteobacteria bacterium ADurb.Bin002]|nr:MAG: hypothetical protein BWX45_00592 [Deltaproteobacteria bacterium ADurb.Bin002]
MRAGGVHEVRQSRKRRAAFGTENDVFGQNDRQIFFRHRHDAAFFAVDHRNGRAPVALAGDAPVAQAVLDGALALAFGFQIIGDRFQHFCVFHAVEWAGVDQNPFINVGLGHRRRIERPVFGRNDDDQLQIEFFGEFEVALVVRGHGHDAAGAVVGQNEVRGVNRHLVAGERIEAVGIQKEAFLLVILGGPHELVLLFDFFHKRPHVFFAGLPLGQFGDQRMLGRHQHEGCAEKRVLARGENLNDAIAFRHWKIDQAAVAFADPVFLHRHDALRPSGETVAVFQKLLGVGRDFEEPLIECFFRNFRAAAPAQAAFDLFVGEHRVTPGAEIHAGALLVSQAFFDHPDEKELFPSVVLGFAGGHFAVPVVAEAHPFELLFHVVDVFMRPPGRMNLVLDGGIFRGHAEGVPADRMENVESFHTLVAGHHVADGVIAHVADMDFPRRIGKHFQQVVFLFIRIFDDFEGFFFFPFLLPFFFDGDRIVLHNGGFLPKEFNNRGFA